jgi:glycosyltransferase involved in cell wall biosynthesis
LHLDVVIPAHDEEHRIDRTLTVYRSICSSHDIRFLVALDNCRDRTAEIVRGHAAEDPRVVLHEYQRLGKGGVIMETFRHADAELVGFVDADCATPPAELLRLAEAAAQADGAIASRWHPAAILPAPRPLSRRLASAAFAFWVRQLFGLPYRDTQCGAKILRREVVEAVLPLLSCRDFLFDVDLLLVARALDFRIVEVPTIWIDREGSRLRVLQDSKRMITSSLRLWAHHLVLPVEPAGRSPVGDRSPVLPTVSVSPAEVGLLPLNQATARGSP